MASRTNASLRVLNDDMQNRVVCSKLPDWLTGRWARQVHKVRESSGHYPSFAEFVKFLSSESDIACNAVFSFQSKGTSTGPSSNKASQVAGKTLNTVQGSKCFYCCQTNHTLDKCFKFKTLPMPEKEKFVKSKHLCFACLKEGHMSKQCKQRLQCSVCDKRHPTPFHGNVRAKLKEPEHKKTEDGKGKATDNAPQSSVSGTQSIGTDKHVSHLVNDAKLTKSTMVVPVYLTHESNSHKEVLTYALLDTQSDTSFITDSVVSQLGLSGTDTLLTLSTMTSEDTLIKCKRITGLSARGHNCDVTLSLPPLFTRGSIPADPECIPVPELAKQWTYLQSMTSELMPKSDCGIGMLIGFNCPRALLPRAVVSPPGNIGPFAQKTDLGWGIVGLEEGNVGEVGFSY